jgi:ubiquinone/menaquinone biosynthesis C-methylase UbiE
MIEGPMQARLADTRLAFDSVAADYDGPRGNNALIQDMRRTMWASLDQVFAPGSRLIDLGCGTGLDAVRMASCGHDIVATDVSAGMLARTRARADREGLTQRVDTQRIGAHELDLLEGRFDGAYSNLGPLNCVPELEAVARGCARLIKSRGAMVVTVIGRLCPWEIFHYARRGRWSRVRVRFARNIVPVGMNHHTIWTRYYTPREFFRPFAHDFALEHFRGLCVFAPPPYLSSVAERHPRLYAALQSLDRRVAGWPLVRGAGDHFLMILRRR